MNSQILTVRQLAEYAVDKFENKIFCRYIVDGETKFVTGGDGELSNAIYAILGRDFAKKTIEQKENKGDNSSANFNFILGFIQRRYGENKYSTRRIRDSINQKLY